ncbi:MAG: SRPBCC family protein [Planctomycetes bacterium]|nr:SRPBCC family protein [Planctomycetota bacterium]
MTEPAPAAPAPDTAPPSPPPSLRTRTIVLWSIALTMAALALALWVRGTWADRAEENPATAAEGTRTQLFRGEDGRVVVRSAAVLDAASDEVWRILTDYARFPETFRSSLWEMKDTRVTQEDPQVWHLQARVDTRLGVFPVDVRARHEEGPERRVASWDVSTAELPRNRGQWVVTPMPEGKALLVFAVEIELPSCPRFLVNNVLLAQNGGVIDAVRERLQSRRH